MVRWCIRLTRLTFFLNLVQVQQNLKRKTFRAGGPQSPFSISSSFIPSVILLPFFLNTNSCRNDTLRAPILRRTFLQTASTFAAHEREQSIITPSRRVSQIVARVCILESVRCLRLDKSSSSMKKTVKVSDLRVIDLRRELSHRTWTRRG